MQRIFKLKWVNDDEFIAMFALRTCLGNNEISPFLTIYVSLGVLDT